MELELSFAEALVLRRGLNALRSVCRDIRVYVHRNSLHLEGLNDSRTAWMQIAFARCFFSSFRLPRPRKIPRRHPDNREFPGDGEDGAEDGQSAAVRFEATVSGKQLWKAIAKAVSPSGNAGGRGSLKLERMRIKGILASREGGNGSAAALSLTFIFRGLPVTQTVLISAVNIPHTLPTFIRWKRRHVVSMPARSWAKLLDEYLLNAENLTVVHDVPSQALKVHSGWQPHAQSRGNAGETSETSAFQGVYGEIVLDKSHLDVLEFDERLPSFSHLTFSSRELRATAALCEHLGVPLVVTYRAPGRPVVCCFGAAAPLASTSEGSGSSSSAVSPSSVFVPHQVLREALRRVQREYDSARRLQGAEEATGLPADLEGDRGVPQLDPGEESAVSNVASVCGDDYLDYVELYRQLEEPLSGAEEEFFSPSPSAAPLSFASSPVRRRPPRREAEASAGAAGERPGAGLARTSPGRNEASEDEESTGGESRASAARLGRQRGGQAVLASAPGDDEPPEPLEASSCFEEANEAEGGARDAGAAASRQERDDDGESVRTWLGQDESERGVSSESATDLEDLTVETAAEKSEKSKEARTGEGRRGGTARRGTKPRDENKEAQARRRSEGVSKHQFGEGQGRVYDGEAEEARETVHTSQELKKATDAARDAARAKVQRWIEAGGLGGAAEMYQHLTTLFTNLHLERAARGADEASANRMGFEGETQHQTDAGADQSAARVPQRPRVVDSSSSEDGTDGEDGVPKEREVSDCDLWGDSDDSSANDSVPLSDVEMPLDWLVTEEDWRAEAW
ncbi:hypothetical protein BESB_076840 [Besnoitia besnoiti]|uniref:Rad9 protein n=1 Tax=Besnoitia besnoiti TaxID=94643 RepID=A0A2A9MCZ1_BESBE|nr:hypothetical protein BESB_076840 [Besnoitia besnoiti]PFH33467.1 hypothetical protein BESB_076840 [Besnoitia besnoiti]